MTNAIGTGQDPALQPAAAASRPPDAGEAALNKSLDQQQLQGRDAVQNVKPDAPPPDPPAPRGKLVDKTV